MRLNSAILSFGQVNESSGVVVRFLGFLSALENLLLIDRADRLAIPDVAEVPFLPAVREEARPEGGGAFAAFVADAAVADAIGSGLAQLGRETLGMGVAVGVVEVCLRVGVAADVVEVGG